jgi:hypothetical protein
LKAMRMVHNWVTLFNAKKFTGCFRIQRASKAIFSPDFTPVLSMFFGILRSYRYLSISKVLPYFSEKMNHP